MKYSPEIAEYKSVRYFQDSRLLLRELISRQFRLQTVYTREPFVTNKSVQSILLVDEKYNLIYILSLLNSLLISNYLVRSSSIALRDDFPKIVLEETRSLPIRRIGFVTPKEERSRLVEEGKRLYFETLAKLGLEADNLSTSNTPPAKSKSAGGGVG